MKNFERPIFITLCITCNIGMIFFHIQKHVSVVKELYRKQKNEKIKEECFIVKAQLIKELCMSKNPQYIKNFAQQELHMQSMRLDKIKILAAHEE